MPSDVQIENEALATLRRHQPEARAQFRIEDIPSVWGYEVSVSWLVEDLIPEGSITLLSGDSGTGKSTLALALAGAVASGSEFLGLATAQRRVLYVDRENPLAIVKERLCRLHIGETDSLRYWGGWVDTAPGGPGDAAVVRFAQQRPLMVFDSLVAFHGGSEQDASETRAHMQLYRRIANIGATVLVVHHTGKSETAREYRGSSDIKAAVDCAYLLSSQSAGVDGISSLTLRAYKNRLTPGRSLHIMYTEAGGFTCGETPRAHPAREIIESILADGVARSQAELVTAMQARGIAYHRALDEIKLAVACGAIAEERGSRNRRTYVLRDAEVRL